MRLTNVALLGLVLTVVACDRGATVPETNGGSQRVQNAGGQDTAISHPGGGGGVDTTITPPPYPTEPVASVTVTMAIAPKTSVSVGDSIGFAAALKDIGGLPLTGRAVTWTSSHDAVVQIFGFFGQYAVARAKGAGTATVTATSEGKAGSVVVTVN